MNSGISWACRGCEAIGIDPGSAAAHLGDTDLEGEHTIDFLDVDGEVINSLSRAEYLTAGSMPEPGPEPAPEPEPEPEPAPDLTLRDLAHLEYIRAVMDELGPEAEIVPCPACSGQGFREMPLPAAPGAEWCPDCEGWGRVSLPSFVAGQLEEMCKRCGGNGWTRTGTVAQLPGPPQPGDAPVLPNPPAGFYWTVDGQLERLPA